MIFMEFFFPPRVAVALRREQMCAKHSFDLETGYDFLTCEDRAQALRLWQTHRPFFTMLSPPCTMYSSMQNLNLAKMDPDVKQKRFNELPIGFRNDDCPTANAEIQILLARASAKSFKLGTAHSPSCCRFARRDECDI